MKVRISPRPHTGPNMTPLVDVVMVILIFLTLAGSFGGAEHFLGYSNPKVVARSVPGAPGSGLEPKITVFIHGGSGPFAATLDDHPVVDAGNLRDQLGAMRQKFQDNGVGPERVSVLLSPSPGAQYQHVIAAYQAVAEAQFTRVAFVGGK